MPTAEDLQRQKKQAEEQKRDAERMIANEKAALRKELPILDKQILDLQHMRTRAAADLGKL